MELLIVVIISGMASGFCAELISFLVERFTILDAKLVKQIFLAPFGALFAWLLDVQGWDILVVGLASAFFNLLIIYYMTRPMTIQQLTTRR
jgi:hypothetical protein